MEIKGSVIRYKAYWKSGCKKLSFMYGADAKASKLHIPYTELAIFLVQIEQITAFQF